MHKDLRGRVLDWFQNISPFGIDSRCELYKAMNSTDVIQTSLDVIDLPIARIARTSWLAVPAQGATRGKSPHCRRRFWP